MTKQQLFGLPSHIVTALRAIFQQYPEINKVLLYGSRAKGNYRPGSDIDLTLDAPTLTLTQMLSIESQIDDLMLPYKVDLSLLHQITNTDLLDHIHRVGVLF